MTDPKLKGKRYILLARCSTKGQADTSIDDQIRLNDRFGTDNAMVKAGEIRAEGVSGSIAKNIEDIINPLIRRKLEFNDFDVLLVQDASRLGRAGAMHAAKIRYELEAAGIEVVFVIGYTPRSDFSEVRDSFDAMAAKQQAKSISMGAARGCQSALEQGRKAHSTFASYGLNKLYLSADGRPLHVIHNRADGTQLRTDSKTGETIEYGRNEATGAPRHYRKQKDERIQLILGDPTHVEVVRRIFREYEIDGLGYWRIALRLNVDGIPGPTGGQWSMPTVRSILNNGVYLGVGVANRSTTALYYSRAPDAPRELGTRRKTPSGRPAEYMRPREEWMEIAYPALATFLPEDIRVLAQARLSRNAGKTAAGRARLPKDKHVESDFILKGILRTKDEGIVMSGRRKGRENGKRYYAASKALNTPTGDGHLRRLVAAEPIERVVLERAREILLSAPNMRDLFIEETRRLQSSLSSAGSDRAVVEGEMKKIDRRIKFLIDELGDHNEEVLRQKLDELRAKRSGLAQSLADLAAPEMLDDDEIGALADMLMGRLARHADDFDRIPRAQLRELLVGLIDSLTIDMRTMEVELTLSLPSWVIPDATLALVEQNMMGLNCRSVCKGTAEAHRPALLRYTEHFRIKGRRRAA